MPKVQQTFVGNRYLLGVSREVVKDLRRAVQRLLGIHPPRVSAQFGQELTRPAIGKRCVGTHRIPVGSMTELRRTCASSLLNYNEQRDANCSICTTRATWWTFVCRQAIGWKPSRGKCSDSTRSE